MLLASGCGCFRASAGFGIGLGASARVGVLDVGCMGGYSHEWGNCYGLEGGMTTGEFGIPVLGRREFLRSEEEGVDRDRREGLFPMVFALTESGKIEYYLNRPTEVAIAVYAGFFSFHVGFEPAAIFRALTGRESPDGTVDVQKDEKDDKIPPLETTKPGELELLLDGRTALVPRHRGDYELHVAPWIALVMSRSETPDWAALARRQTAKGAGDLARARATRDPALLEAAIAATPLSVEVPDAARILGEVQLERGELEEACMAFELESLLRPVDEEASEARARVALAHAARAHELVPVHESHATSVALGGVTLATEPQSIWAVTPEGEIAWTRTDSLTENECFRSPVGAAVGLAIFEVGPDPGLNNNAASAGALVALDEKGTARWRVELPFEGKDTAIEHRLYLVSGGRVYVILRSNAVAIDARTGRLEWFYARPPRTRPYEMPFDRRLLSPIWTKQPFATLANGVLEWHADASLWQDAEPGRVERLDARTGVPVGEGPFDPGSSASLAQDRH